MVHYFKGCVGLVLKCGMSEVVVDWLVVNPYTGFKAFSVNVVCVNFPILT